MLKRLLLTMVLLSAGVVAYGAVQPSAYRIERSAVMAASPAEIYAEIEDFHRWQAWSPWAKRDPAAKVTFEGPEKGKGAAFAWSGNDDVGEGSMTIVDSRPAERVDIKLDFVRPFPDTAMVDLSLKTDGYGTRVTWGLAGENNLMERIFCLFFDMDAMIGADYEQGLASLARLVEKGRSVPPGSPPAGSNP